VGEDGPTHHGTFDLSYLRHIPNMTVMAPRDEKALVDALATSLALECPCAFRYPRGRGVGVEVSDPAVWKKGKGELLREGSDVLLVGVGSVVHPCLEAARDLEKEGLNVAVIDARFIKPLDEELIFGKAAGSRLTVTVEENVLAGGFGSAVLESAALRGETALIRCLGLPDSFVEQGSLEELRAELGLDAAGIRNFVKETLARERP